MDWEHSIPLSQAFHFFTFVHQTRPNISSGSNKERSLAVDAVPVPEHCCCRMCNPPPQDPRWPTLVPFDLHFRCIHAPNVPNLARRPRCSSFLLSTSFNSSGDLTCPSQAIIPTITGTRVTSGRRQCETTSAKSVSLSLRLHREPHANVDCTTPSSGLTVTYQLDHDDSAKSQGASSHPFRQPPQRF